eukprot:gnl/MRDRNA2_/MRDRNA2_121684_c0_seq1.p1 gnl/MRDRNA2_/MRDRNA2_121684_c0~~gnl/MRDRNA2_/MRDRNA2_121684_c0_seq1.p1  ORF type:complete len:203 (-),score=36.88 gnl/MRDRNA2_/MRDRNA2_121684_c0_seq1:108-716(-)
MPVALSSFWAYDSSAVGPLVKRPVTHFTSFDDGCGAARENKKVRGSSEKGEGCPFKYIAPPLWKSTTKLHPDCKKELSKKSQTIGAGADHMLAPLVYPRLQNIAGYGFPGVPVYKGCSKARKPPQPGKPITIPDDLAPGEDRAAKIIARFKKEGRPCKKKCKKTMKKAYAEMPWQTVFGLPVLLRLQAEIAERRRHELAAFL